MSASPLDPLTELGVRMLFALRPVLGADDARLAIDLVVRVVPAANRRRFAWRLREAEGDGTGDANRIDLRIWERTLDALALALGFDDDDFDALSKNSPGLDYRRLARIAANLRDAVNPRDHAVGASHRDERPRAATTD